MNKKTGTNGARLNINSYLWLIKPTHNKFFIMGLLTGKVALITGATRGIGRAIATKYATEGANVAFTYLSSEEAAQSLVAELEGLGVKAIGYRSDAASYDQAHTLVAEVQKEFGKIDILVHNAGITRDTLLMRMGEEMWDAVINTNLKSAYNITHAITSVMARQRSGSIIYMSSVVGLGGNAGQANYAASKAGLIALAKSVAKELGARGVRANCIAPGFIQTDMTAVLSDDIKASFVENISLRRAGTPEDVAGVALFLGSDMSAYVTGQTIACCGGMRG